MLEVARWCMEAECSFTATGHYMDRDLDDIQDIIDGDTVTEAVITSLHGTYVTSLS